MKIKRMSAKILGLILAIAFFIAAGAASVYAFFTSDFFKKLTGKIDENGNGIAVAEISSFDDLWKYSIGAEETEINGAAAVTGKFNDFSGKTESNGRRILRFSADVTLVSDLTITADCHIDLNGKTLYLNGHDLAISHTYAGSFVLSGGTIRVDAASENEETASKEGKVYFDMPYAVPSSDTAVFTKSDGTVLSSSDYAIDVSKNERVIAYHALKAAALKTANYADVIPSAVRYSELLSQSGTEFSDSLFLSEKICAAGGDEAERCAFVFGDLDLPLHVGAYGDVSIEYAFENSLIDEYGKVTFSSAVADETLTIGVKRAGKTIGVSTWKLHIADPSDESQALSAGKSILNAYLYRYYTNIAAAGETPDYTYEFKRAVQLPKKIFLSADHYVEYAYAAYSDSALSAEVSGTISAVDEYAVLLEPTSAVRRLTATVYADGKTTGEQSVYKVTASDSGLIRTDASYAQDFIVDNYGGEILILATKNQYGTYSFGSQTLKTPKNGGAYENIVSVKYTLINDTNSLYALSGCDSALEGDMADGQLYVQEGKNPLEYVQTVQLDCLFTFKSGNTADIQIPVRCSDSQSENVNGFLIYYNYYDQMFFSSTGGYTIRSFDMPFATGNKVSDYVVCYDLAVETTDADGNVSYEWNKVKGISVGLYYGGENHDFTATTGSYAPYTQYVSYVAALEKYLSDNSLTVADIIAYGDAKWVFTIDISEKSEIGDENQNFSFVYNYKTIYGSAFSPFTDSSDRLKATAFTLPGILKYSSAAGDGVITDANMYNWLGKVFGGESFTGEAILTDWLRQNKPVDVTDAENGALLAAVTDFGGLKYVKGATYVNLSGVNLSGIYADTMSAIAQMEAVEELNLSNCGLSANGVSASAPNDANLEKLTALKNLKTLRLSNAYGTTTNLNTIYSFEFLLNIASLNRAYVYGNLDTGTVNGVFYGSEGLVNMEYFEELTQAGVYVYNTASSTSEFLFEQSAGTNDFKSLKSIEYQKKLKNGQDISSVYQSFTTAAPSDLGLKSSYTIGTSSFAVSNQALTWGHDGDAASATYFYVKYTLTVSGITVTITVKFDVVRV